MKHVFEFYGKDKQLPQVGGGGDAYAYPSDEPPAYHGGRIDLLACDGPSPLRPEGDCLYIEGDIESVRHIGEEIVRHCTLMEALWREEAERARERSTECPACGAWKEAHLSHADWRGNRCLGDGRVQISRMVQIVGTSSAVLTSALLAGQQFTMFDPIGDADRRVLTALEDGTRDGVVVHWPPERRQRVASKEP